jgi:hypothetical protein
MLQKLLLYVALAPNMDTDFSISMKRRETGVPGGKPSSRNIVFNLVGFAI